MDPITMGLIALIGFSMFGKKKEDKTTAGDESGTTTTTKTGVTGTPSLTITDINNRPGYVLDNVKYTFSGSGETYDGKHKLRDKSPNQKVVGDFMVITATDPSIRPGQRKADVIMVIVKDRENRTIIAKRILVDDEQIVDVQ